MAADINNKPLRCSKIEITGTSISELDGNRPVVKIPREQILSIELCYDTDSKYPFCQYFLGFTLLSLGLIGLVVTFFASIKWARFIQPESGNFVIPLVPITLWLMVGTGFWLLLGIFRAKFHLWIETENGIYRIFFDKKAAIKEIQQFVRQADLCFGYAIDISILEKILISS